MVVCLLVDMPFSSWNQRRKATSSSMVRNREGRVPSPHLEPRIIHHIRDIHRVRQRPDRLRVPRKRAERCPRLAQHPEADVLFGVEREDECVGLDAEGEVFNLLEGLFVAADARSAGNPRASARPQQAGGSQQAAARHAAAEAVASSHAQQPRRSSTSSLRGASLRNGFVLTCLSAPSASCCRLRGRGPWSGGRYALWIPDSEHESGRWPRPWLASQSRQ